MPNSPQAKYTVQRIKETIIKWASKGERVDPEAMALDIWNVAKELRPIHPPKKEEDE